MFDSRELVHRVAGELRQLNTVAPRPTEDIDMVWALSAPGTVYRSSDDPFYVYNDMPADRIRVEYAAEIAREITGLRMGVGPFRATKQDIQKQGPTLFYNGENRHTRNFNDPQAEDFLTYVSKPEFVVPLSNIIVGHIREVGTLAQVFGLAEYVQNSKFIGKIAVVTMAVHSVRVGRYLEHYRAIFPREVEFINMPIGEAGTDNSTGKALREIRKVVDFVAKGDLACESYFRTTTG